jgi:hypothetical protein
MPPFFIFSEDAGTTRYILKRLDIRGRDLLVSETRVKPEWAAIAEVAEPADEDAAHKAGVETETYTGLNEVVDDLIEDYKAAAFEFIEAIAERLGLDAAVPHRSVN